MADHIEPGLAPGARKRVVFISILFILFGIGIIPMSLTAYRAGTPIPMLSRGREIYGWEGFVTSFLAIVVGIGGIWAVHRLKRRPSVGP
jgi:hypothetical protein